MCVCARAHVIRYPQKPGKGGGYPGTEVTGMCEPQDVGVGN